MSANHIQQIAIASSFAEAAHRDQVDKSGVPYIEHPRMVADMVEGSLRRLAPEGHAYVYVAAALLHDVIEDCDVSLADLRAASLDERIVEAVDALSRRKGEVYRRYIVERVAPNHVARAVKIADLRHNCSPARMAALDPGVASGLLKRYSMSLAFLEGGYRVYG